MDMLLIAALLVMGFVFIVIELFIVPGFSLPGIMGLAMIGYGLFRVGTQYGFTAVVSVTTICFIASIALIRLALKSPLARRVGLSFNQTGNRAVDDYSSLTGGEGTALTTLRPAGTAIINGERRDVVTDGEFIEAGEKLVVTTIDGGRIVVTRKQGGR